MERISVRSTWIDPFWNGVSVGVHVLYQYKHGLYECNERT